MVESIRWRLDFASTTTRSSSTPSGSALVAIIGKQSVRRPMSFPRSASASCTCALEYQRMAQALIGLPHNLCRPSLRLCAHVFHAARHAPRPATATLWARLIRERLGVSLTSEDVDVIWQAYATPIGSDSSVICAPDMLALLQDLFRAVFACSGASVSAEARTRLFARLPRMAQQLVRTLGADRCIGTVHTPESAPLMFSSHVQAALWRRRLRARNSPRSIEF